MTTTLSERSRRSSLPSRAGTVINGAIERLLYWHSLRRERRDLAALDERILRDIGLTWADVEFGFGKPFWKR